MAAHLPVPEPREATPACPHNQQVMRGVGHPEEGWAWLAAYHEPLERQPVGSASPGRIHGLTEPLAGRLCPDLPEVGRGLAAVGELAAGRRPGMNGHEQGALTARKSFRIAQGRDTPR